MTRVYCDERNEAIDFIFGTADTFEHGNTVLTGHPQSPKLEASPPDYVNIKFFLSSVRNVDESFLSLTV